MPIKVQRVPRELLALLGIVGDNPPSNLLEDYRGTIEMINMVISALPVEQEFSTIADIPTAGTQVVTVPQGEIWFVEGVQASITIATAAERIDSELFWSGALLDTKSYIPNVTVTSNAAVRTHSHGWHAARGFPLIAKAGEDFTGRCAGRTGAGAIAYTTFVRFRRVRS